WLGLGLILALFCAADLVSLRATYLLDAALSSLVHDGEARSAAAYEMKRNLQQAARALHLYSQDRDPKQRGRFKDAEAGFNRALEEYRALASTETSRALAQEATQ